MEALTRPLLPPPHDDAKPAPGRRWLRAAGWAVAAFCLAGFTFGFAAPRDEPLPPRVVSRIEQTHYEARRRGPAALETALPSPGLGAVIRQSASWSALDRAPPAPAPGCAYRSSLASAAARLSQDPPSYLYSGQAALEAGQLEDAAYYFDQARRIDPEHPVAGTAAFWLGETRLRQGKTVEALVAFRKVKGEYAEEARYRRAWLSEHEGRGEEAREDWQALSGDASSPHRAEALYWLGRGAYVAARYPEAEDLLARSAKLADPASDVAAAALYLLALVQRERGALVEARTQLETLLLSRPDHAAAPPARLLLGWIFLETGNPGEAGRRFAKFLEEPADAGLTLRARYGLVRAASARGDEKALAAAVADLPAEAAQGPWLAWALADVGRLEFDRGRYPQAYKAFADALAQGRYGEGEDAVRYLAAECLLRQDNPSGAAEAFGAMPPEAPLAPDALRRAGQAARMARDDARAAKYFDLCLAGYPAYPERDRVRMELGETRLAMGRADEARRAYEAVQPDSPLYAEALSARGRIALDGQRWDEAAKIFGEFRSRFPQDARGDEAALTLARAHYLRRALPEALAVLEDLERTGTTAEARAAARYNRGWMLVRGGDEDQGCRVLEELATEDPEGPYAARSLYVLGASAMEDRRYGEALDRFDSVVRLAKGGVESEEALRYRADCLFQLGRYEKALAGYMGVSDTAAGLYGKALSLQKLGRGKEFAAAVEAFERGAPMDERRGELRRLLADSLVAEGRHAEAAAQYEKAALSLPEAAAGNARLLQGRELAAAGRDDEAAQVFTELSGEEGAAGRAALRELAEAHGRAQRFERALEALDEALRKTKGATAGEAAGDAARAAYFARRAGRWEEAEARIRKALSLAGTDEAARRRFATDLGEILIERGAAVAAADTLAQADRQRPASEAEGLRTLLLLARAQESAGRGDVALETWQRIGYVYTQREPGKAAAFGLDSGAAEQLLAVADRLAGASRRELADAMYRRLESEAPAPWSETAKERLAGRTPAPQDSRPVPGSE